MKELSELIGQILTELGGEEAVKELTAVVVTTPEGEVVREEEEKPKFSDEEVRRLKDLVTKEWPQIEQLKKDADELHKLATNEGLKRLKQMYDENEDRFKTLIIERWDRLVWLLALPLEAIQEIVVIAVPLIRLFFPQVINEVRVRLDEQPERRDSLNIDVIVELLHELWTMIGWIQHIVSLFGGDFASMVVYTYPKWRDGVGTQVEDDIIKNW
jgi:hypothetical protein